MKNDVKCPRCSKTFSVSDTVPFTKVMDSVYVHSQEAHKGNSVDKIADRISKELRII